MRADSFFARKYGSRTRAKEALLKGEILRGGKPLSPADEVREGDAFAFAAAEEYASRGAYKLLRGLDAFGESPAGQVFADLGASTGGFCDVLLRRGAKRVFAVDVGKSQLLDRLASDSRVTVMDGTNARFLKKEDFPVPLDGVTSDLSFISLRLVLPAAAGLLEEGGKAFVLFKPQFECGCAEQNLQKELKKGVLPVRFHRALLSGFYAFCRGCALMPQNIVNAPLAPHKNVEYVVFLRKGGEAIGEAEFLSRAAALS